MTVAAPELKRALERGGKANPFWIVGPCVLEDEKTVFAIAEKLVQVRDRLHVPVVFKASFDKANRTSIKSPRGPGLKEGLRRLAAIRKDFGLPILTDVHETSQVAEVAQVVDILQVPAFLSRQTDLIQEAAKSGRAVNVKKGQFLAPDNVKALLEKLQSGGSSAHWITERGVTFGYHRLVVDFSGFNEMESAGADLIFDCTHSVQLPGSGEVTGGLRSAIPSLARAAAAVGVKGFFAETHPQPEKAWSDAANAWPLDRLEALISDIQKVASSAHGLTALGGEA
jgi:2-dehydro-3-deoxyphosphooctonate aldolase (KDO 8-P synthase)